MTQMIGDYIGADDVSRLMADLGIHGDEISGKHRVPHSQVVPNSNVGRARTFPMLLTSGGTSLATTVSGTLTGTADRDAVLRKLFLFCSLETTYANAAAGTATSYTDNKALVFCTGISVGGRNAVIGSGSSAIRGYDRDSLWMPHLGVLASGNPVIVSLNNASAVTQIVSGFFAAQCVD